MTKTVCTLLFLLAISSCASPAQRYSDAEENAVGFSVADKPQSNSANQSSPQNMCANNQSKALNSLEELNSKTNEKYGYVILMRHGYAPRDDKAAQGDNDLGNCEETHRHLRNTGQVTKLGALFERDKVNFNAVYASEACRARETANAMGLGDYVVKKKLNPPSIHGGKSEKTAKFIKNLKPGPGEAYLLVTHSDIIPGVVAKYGVLRKMTQIGDAEAFVLRRVDGSYQCQATITPPTD